MLSPPHPLTPPSHTRPHPHSPYPPPPPPSGEKVIRVVDCLGDTKASRSSDVKDEIVLQGTDIDCVSRTCALIQQICAVKNKDIRKFLDGIYVSHKGNIEEE